MSALPNVQMNVDEYLAWAQARSGRYELVDGKVYAMAPERAAHAETKLAVYLAFAAALRAARLPCYLMPDGMTVRVDEATAYEPDALLYCGAKVPPSALEVPNPIVIVEVVSPSTRHVDASLKLAGYFRLPSVAHYLIVDPDKPLIIHHRRATETTILTQILHSGTILLDPPGLTIALEEIYAPGA